MMTPCLYAFKSPVRLTSPRPSPGIALKPAPHIGMGYRLHQLAHFVLQKVVGENQRPDGRARVATARRNHLIDGNLQRVDLVLVCLRADSQGGIGRWACPSMSLFRA